MNIQVRDGLPYVTVTLLYGGRQLELANVLFGCWYRSRKKASIAGTIRPGAVFAQSGARYAAPCRLVRHESHKDGEVPYKTVKIRAIQRYAVLCGLLWCYMDTGSNCMVQCGAIRRVAV
jgi:hypothetical protein